jgi:hypothetical protein
MLVSVCEACAVITRVWRKPPGITPSHQRWEQWKGRVELLLGHIIFRHRACLEALLDAKPANLWVAAETSLWP